MFDGTNTILNSDVDQDVCFARKISNLSSTYKSRYPKKRYKKDKTQQYIQLNTSAEEIQPLNPGEPQPSHLQISLYRTKSEVGAVKLV